MFFNSKKKQAEREQKEQIVVRLKESGRSCDNCKWKDVPAYQRPAHKVCDVGKYTHNVCVCHESI